MKALIIAAAMVLLWRMGIGATIQVPDDQTTIQAGINAASDEDTVLVAAGIYIENITINKPIRLIGEAQNSTIIDGSDTGDVVLITSDNVQVSNFSINSGGSNNPDEHAWDAGIRLEAADSCLIEYCKFSDNKAAAIAVGNSSYNAIEHCIFFNNYSGIYFYTNYETLPPADNVHNIIQYNRIYGNQRSGLEFAHGLYVHDHTLIHANYLANNWRGIEVIMFSFNEVSYNNFCDNTREGFCLTACIMPTDSNVTHHNAFIQNNAGGVQALDEYGWEAENFWYLESTSEGNYWSDYTGIDGNGDGIGDTPYLLDGNAFREDPYPLMEPPDDTDGDGIIDSVDNCLFVSNYDQVDVDYDLVGDACDDCIDTDGDGFGNPGYPDNVCQIDNCPDDYNPDQADIDGDGLGDICDYICGDTNRDGSVNVSDAVFIINFVFVGGAEPVPLKSGDVNCDRSVNVSDAVWIINYVFVNGNEPCDIDGDSIFDC